MIPALPVLIGFFLTLTRVSALVGSAPVLSSKTIPVRIKAALAFLVALVAYSAAGMPRVEPGTLPTLVALVIAETALGLAAGLSGRILLEAAQVGGQAASTALGFGFGQVVNPMTQVESTQVGEVLSILALGSAIALGLHREALAWVARSVVEVPPGATVDLAGLGVGLVRQILFGLTLAVRVAYPLLAIAVLGYGVLGLLGKAAPQLSLSNLGFGLTIVAGGGGLYLMAPPFAHMCAEAALRVFAR